MTLLLGVLRRLPLAVGLCSIGWSAQLHAQQPAGAAPPAPTAPVAHAHLASFQPRPGEHPLSPALRWAQVTQRNVATIKDYSCTFVKREKVGDELTDHQYLFVKVRHEPFSVYIYFLGPDEFKGREAIYVEGKNGGNILAHTTGLKDTLLGTLTLKPDSAIAMQGNRHPINQIGLLNLTKRMADSTEQASRFSLTECKPYPGAKVNGRVCTCLQFVNTEKRPEFEHQLARVFIDEELNLPIRYEAYEWPSEAGGQPELVEEYTYVNLKFNNNFTDEDFNHKNSAYRFR